MNRSDRIIEALIGGGPRSIELTDNSYTHLSPVEIIEGLLYYLRTKDRFRLSDELAAARLKLQEAKLWILEYDAVAARLKADMDRFHARPDVDKEPSAESSEEQELTELVLNSDTYIC